MPRAHRYFLPNHIWHIPHRGAGLGSGLTWLTLGAEWPVSVVLATWDADGVSLDRVDFKAKKWGPRLFRSPGA